MVARSIVERFDLSVPAGMGVRGADGRDYSWFGIGSVILVVPLHITGKLIGVPPENLFIIMNPLVGAATAVLVFLFSFSLGYSRRASLYASIIYGLGTMAWYYSKDPGDHAIETFIVLLSIYFMYRYAIDKKVSHLLLSALSLGFALTVRPTTILAIPPLFILMIFCHLKKSDFKTTATLVIKNVILFSIALLPFVALNLWYNYCRFGSVFETGYTLMAAQWGVEFFAGTSLLTGLQGLLLSPGKGFFYYSPVAVLFFFSIRSFSKKHPVTALCFISIMIFYLLFYSTYTYWHGDWAWGPRFIFILTPFLIIPIAALFDSAMWQTKKTKKMFIYAIFAVSLVVQLAAVSVNHNRYFSYLQIEEEVKFVVADGNGVPALKEPPPEIYFDWSRSPILAQAKFVHEMIGDLKNYWYTESPMNPFDFWWLYEYLVKGTYSGFIAVPTLLLLLILCSASRLRKFG
jgi:4-amino-4-deoxy-L-arabinose transferase-like glycosyltransferase